MAARTQVNGGYRDRAEAGEVLAQELAGYAGRDVVVLGLPRGGVPVAAAVARHLDATLDVLMVRKLGVPGQPEVAMGAIAAWKGSLEVVRNEILHDHPICSEADFNRVREQETTTLREQERRLRSARGFPRLESRVVLVIDDGLATGMTMQAALRCVRHHHPTQLIAAVPVRLGGADQQLAADEVICPWAPTELIAVGQAYQDFAAVEDSEVRRLLARSS